MVSTGYGRHVPRQQPIEQCESHRHKITRTGENLASLAFPSVECRWTARASPSSFVTSGRADLELRADGGMEPAPTYVRATRHTSKYGFLSSFHDAGTPARRRYGRDERPRTETGWIVSAGRRRSCMRRVRHERTSFGSHIYNLNNI